MRKPTVGILTFSDGRKSVHEDLRAMNEQFQNQLKGRLEAAGCEVVTGEQIIWTPELARKEAQRLQAAHVDLTIFNFAIWAFPHLPMMAAQFLTSPLLLLSNVNPQYPGMVGMLAAAGALNQVGRGYERVWGDIRDEQVFGKVMKTVRAAGAVSRLKGQTYGLFGGRPMGMYTAVSNPEDWIRIFGVDVEHIDQWEVVRRSERVPQARLDRALSWLESKVRAIHYDGKKLTPEYLKRQIAAYHAMREIIDEKGLDFCGIKSQTELTDHFCITDVPEAFLNDPYDWEGPHEPIVCATEADMDAALTMQIFKYLAGTPVLFADVRHYHESLNMFDLCNSGQHATYFAARSFNPDENLRHVELWPALFYFASGGASVQHLAAPGEATFARLTRTDGHYVLHVLKGQFVQYGGDRDIQLMKETTWEWPHAFAVFESTADEFLGNYASNHIHAVYGDFTGELAAVGKLLSLDVRMYGSRK